MIIIIIYAGEPRRVPSAPSEVPGKRWDDYHARQLEELKRENREESDRVNDWKILCENEVKSSCGETGHLLEHPDEVSIILTGGHQSSLVEDFTLSERACGDDLSTTMDIKEYGSEGHLLEHPDQPLITLTGDHSSSPREVFAGSERASGDDPSVSEIEAKNSEEENSEDDRIHVRFEDGSVIYRRYGGWTSVGDRIQKRHKEGRQAFRKRKREVKRGIYVEPPRTSILSPGWGLPEKGTADWDRIRN
jgi:hypothetical protein